MVTTRQLLALVKKESKEKGEAKDKAIKEWEEKIAKKGSKKMTKEKKMVERYQSTKRLGILKSGSASKIAKRIFSQIVTEYKKGLKPVRVKRRPIPKKRIRHPRDMPMPQKQRPTLPTVRQLQSTPNIKKLLTPSERAEVEKSPLAMWRYNAVQILRKKLKEQEMIQKLSTLQSNKISIKKEIPGERWLK